jgi:epoxyqueuosine reductase
MSVAAKELKEWAGERGYGLAIAGPGIVGSVLAELESRRASGEIEAGFYKENLTWVRNVDGSALPETTSIVLVAVPCPIHVLPVKVGGRKLDTLIPPTYVRYQATFAAVLADMKANVLGAPAEAAVFKVPLKSMAAHMGLVKYGRNNITYCPGLGSSYQLCAFRVPMGEKPADVPAGTDGRETMLERCKSCRACVKACPTGAIREDRFLLSGERCFTRFSESRSPIPAWAKPPRSLCLIGCMACQEVCPENKGRLRTEPSGVELAPAETEAILEAGRRLSAAPAGAESFPNDPAWASAFAKVETLGMTEDLDVMGRNLGYFLSRK